MATLQTNKRASVAVERPLRKYEQKIRLKIIFIRQYTAVNINNSARW